MCTPAQHCIQLRNPSDQHAKAHVGLKSPAESGAAVQVRTLVQRELTAALGEWDLLLSPAAPTTAYRVGQARPQVIGSEPLSIVLLSPVAPTTTYRIGQQRPWSIGPNPFS